MADSPVQHSKDKHTGKGRQVKRQIVRVDLTPMVDLAFLLITFFMLTTSLIQPMAMKVEKRIDHNQDPVSPCRVLNILADSADRIYSYNGDDLQTLKQVGESGVRKAIIEKRQWVKQNCGMDKNGLPYDMICLVKLSTGSKFRNMVDILDEIRTIDTTLLYSLQEPGPEEIAAIRAQEMGLALRNP